MATSRKRKKATKRKKSSPSVSRSIKALLTWCEEAGVVVKFSSTVPSEWNEENNVITVSTRHTKEVQLCYLLHEAGHMLAARFPDPNRQIEGRGYARISDVDTAHNSLKIDKTYVVIDEIDAWERGFQLAQRLKLKLDTDKFNLIRSNSLQTYFAWAVEPLRCPNCSEAVSFTGLSSLDQS